MSATARVWMGEEIPSSMSDLVVEERDGAVRFTVRVSPRASREAILGVHDGALKVALTAPPVDGAANAALIALLAKKLGVPKGGVRIASGESSRTKVVSVEGSSVGDVRGLVAR